MSAPNEFSPKQHAYLRREVQRGIDQLDRRQHSNFTAETIIAQERRRMARIKRPK